MGDILPLVIANGGAALTTGLTFTFLFLRHRERHLGLWGAGWCVAAFTLLVNGWALSEGSEALAGLTTVPLVVAAFLQLRGAYAFVARRYPIAWDVAAGVALLVALVGVAFGAPFKLVAVPGSLVGLFAVGAVGAVLLRPTPRLPGAWMAGGGHILMALHALSYPLAIAYPRFLPWGYTIGVLLNLITAVGLLMLHHDRVRIDLLHSEREQRGLQEQLAQARRMEAVGRLSSGVAHDFNNLLTAILCNAELALTEPDVDDEVRESLEAITLASDQARRLTKQLLAFGRRAHLKPAPMDLVSVLADTHDVIRRLLPANVAIELRHNIESLTVVADRGHFEQLVMNLASNAGDAMPDGGQLVVALEVDDGDHADPVSLTLSVSDTGEGMDPDTRSRMFEPFFTTRQLGRGTGLGLATVDGIVGQLQGRIEVESELGVGTTIRILLTLPRAAEEAEARADTHAPAGQSAAVLVVEDDPQVRRVTEKVLRAGGHRVTVAEHGRAALALLDGDLVVDCVISDVMMPEMGGVELMQHLRRARPALPILLMSAYADRVAQGEALPADVELLPKPCSVEQMLSAVQRALTAQRASDG